MTKTDDIQTTPGPWITAAFEPPTTHARCPTTGYVLLWDALSVRAGFSQWAFQPTKADADLIAAAPDLLVACERLEAALNQESGVCDYDGIDDAGELAAAAIAKARGDAL